MYFTFSQKMSLSITIVTLDPDTKRICDSDPYPENGEDLVGFESWRSEVYASSAFKSRGATYLPTLDSHELVVDSEHLELFRSEVETLLSDIENLGKELNLDPSQLGHRLRNMLSATLTAIREGKAVWIC